MKFGSPPSTLPFEEWGELRSANPLLCSICETLELSGRPLETSPDNPICLRVDFNDVLLPLFAVVSQSSEFDCNSTINAPEDKIGGRLRRLRALAGKTEEIVLTLGQIQGDEA